MSIKISVVIPTFKRPALLIKCLNKLAMQDFPKEHYELIIVTDGPDIETKTVLKSFSRQPLSLSLTHYSLDKKKGPAAARNKAVDHARGELIVFTDDDCLPQVDWLSAYWDIYKAVNETEAAFSGQTIVPHSKIPTDYEKNIAHLQTAEYITANCAITKAAFERVGGFDENFPIAWREDSDMHFKLIKASVKLYKVKSAIVIHPVRKSKWGVSLKEQKKSVFNALLYKKHPSLYKQKINSKPLWNYYIMTALFGMGALCLVNGLHIAALISFFGWMVFVAEFTCRRLNSTSKKISHIVEMIITSALIPFLSVFWTLYGSLKYKTLFL